MEVRANDVVRPPGRPRDCATKLRRVGLCLHRRHGPRFTVAWLLLTFLGVLGIHRFYMGKVLTGLLWLCTFGLLGVGLLYDLLTLNEQVDEMNRAQR